MSARRSTERLGATPLENERCRFLVWAPRAKEVSVFLPDSAQSLPLQRDERGYHRGTLPGVPAGTSYLLRLDGRRDRPDPASLHQPGGVHGPSQVVDLDYPWKDVSWKGPALGDYVIYELHTGTFTQEGTFDGILAHLERLEGLGITALELMPVAQFPGERNWGYDGVLPFATQCSYGGPRALQRLVDACHAAGLAVILDVVYNHLGPEGNHLAEFGPYFTDVYRTPWGAALNVDGADSDEVRRFLIENALRWIEDFHIDALRLDAVHTLHDRSAYPLLEELADEVRECSTRLGRPVHLIAEDDTHDPRLVRPSARGGIGLGAVWCDDLHHALHRRLTGEERGYYADYAELRHLALAWERGLAFTGEPSRFRRHRQGRPAERMEPGRVVVCAQNHDQIGNRRLGERLSALVGFEAQKLAAGVVLLSPHIPLLFQGEEYGELAPFQYFVSHGDPDLVERVRQGRRAELATLGETDESSDPQSEETFRRCRLDHELRHHGPHARLFSLHGALLELRRELRTGGGAPDSARAFEEQAVLVVHRPGVAWMLFHFGAEPCRVALAPPEGPWHERLASAATQWGGPGQALRPAPGAVWTLPLVLRRLHTSPSPTRAEQRNLNVETWPGNPYPLGATFDGNGTNFALYSSVAETVELCLFDAEGRETRVELPEVTAYIWHGYFPRLGPGQRYGFRVHGPDDPPEGHLCNPNKLLVDPYAKAIEGQVEWNPALFGHDPGDDPQRNDADSAPFVPKGVVVNPYFDWRGDRVLRTPWHHTVIYELHVKGFTKRFPDVPPDQRGTYSGLAHPAVIAYLKDLGVTAVELMPVHQFISEHALVERELSNYWGYNTLGFFAPHNAYSTGGDLGGQVQEFKNMVRCLHEAGIEVILDVVYNHTCEGNHQGPTLSFRGLDNASYYRLSPKNRAHYVDYTGCGNSLNMKTPHVLQLIMDSLRYWVLEMHVDGFRFDLAAALARELHAVNRLSAFFDLIQQDPVISQVKLIAEPWDIGEGGYQVGNFPPLWSEWNPQYRDTVRDFWRGAEQTVPELANRLTGSSDLYESNGRRPYASINFVTCHDGFTLRDQVSYGKKHNKANGEHNRDGESDSRSWNCGVEGETEDPEILALRARQQRNLLTTIFLSQGVPMLLAGDELGRTQQGNNNAYCQDTELSWMDWENMDVELLEFTRRLIHFTNEHRAFSRRGWFQGHPVRGAGLRDIGWFRPDGIEMSDEDWNVDFAKSLAFFINGQGITGRGRHGQVVTDDDFYVLLNGFHEALTFRVPDHLPGPWKTVLDTAAEPSWVEGTETKSGDEIEVTSRSVVLLIHAR